jgi:hypothetical protein
MDETMERWRKMEKAASSKSKTIKNHGKPKTPPYQRIIQPEHALQSTKIALKKTT